MGLLCIGTYYEDDFHLLDFPDGVGHGSRAQFSGQTGHRGGVSEPGAVVHIDGANHHAHEFLKKIVLFVCATG